MKARLGFTTALLTHVDIMLVDEILSVGDAHFKKKAEAALKERIEGKQTVVFVSHSEKQIHALCDRVIWLDEGRVAAHGDTSDVLSLYNDYIESIPENKH
jgi:lipopolysaccharide transport system ATP-binding protein